METSRHFAPAVPLRPDPEKIARIWERYVETREETLRMELITAYSTFVRMMAAKVYARRTYSELEFDDYLQYATVGMLEAVDRFDPRRGIKFETFASSRITGAMLNGIEISTEVQQQIVARRLILAQRAASLLESASQPDKPDAIFARLAEVAIGLAVGMVLEGSGMHCEVDAEYADNSYRGLELKQLRGKVQVAVSTLPENQRQVIQSHYLQHLPFEEVARNMDLTKGRIAQLHKQALETLRKKLRQAPEVDLSC